MTSAQRLQGGKDISYNLCLLGIIERKAARVYLQGTCGKRTALHKDVEVTAVKMINVPGRCSRGAKIVDMALGFRENEERE